MTDLQQLDKLLSQRIADGLNDEDIARDLMAIGSQAHLELGRLVKPADLVALLRHRITTPEDQWIAVNVGDEDRQLCIHSNSEGVTFDLWAAKDGQPVGDEPLASGYMVPDDILDLLGVAAPWNQAWLDAKYNPHDQPMSAIRIEQSQQRLGQLTDAQLTPYAEFSQLLDDLDLWDLPDEAQRRQLYERWLALHFPSQT
jgi:hypothetical protein